MSSSGVRQSLGRMCTNRQMPVYSISIMHGKILIWNTRKPVQNSKTTSEAICDTCELMKEVHEHLQIFSVTPIEWRCWQLLRQSRSKCASKADNQFHGELHLDGLSICRSRLHSRKKNTSIYVSSLRRLELALGHGITLSPHTFTRYALLYPTGAACHLVWRINLFREGIVTAG